MPKKNKDLHGNAPDKSNVALLIIDVINDLGFDTGPQLLPAALVMAKHIAALKARAVKAGVPVIYANDNFGKWRSDFSAQVRHSLKPGIRGAPIVKMLIPEPRDYFVIKPKHSGFFATPLELLLNYLAVKNLIITGIAADNCVLFTANDAYIRDFNLWVPGDCVASVSKRNTLLALKQMQQLLKANINPSSKINFKKLKA